jgi:hypothetical protein
MQSRKSLRLVRWVPASAALVALTLAPVGQAGASLRFHVPRATAPNGDLSGIACKSHTWCMAVGGYQNGSSYHPLSELWNGTRWKDELVPGPSGTDGALSAVECTSASACFAVGYAGSQPLVDKWNGTNWMLVSAPIPKGSTTTYFDGVACGGPSACVAVGQESLASGVGHTVAEAWSGSSWSVKPTPSFPGSADGFDEGVACTSTTSCIAAGEFENGQSAYATLAEKWNGTTWKSLAQPAQPRAGTAGYEGIACPTTSTCYAVGFTPGPKNEAVLVEAWNGSHWSLMTVPNPVSTSDDRLNGVACTTTTSCVSVGYYENEGEIGKVIAEKLSGTTWSLQSGPNVPGAKLSELQAVACASANYCIAVGESVTGSNPEKTLGEIWNGTSWKLMSTINGG